MWPMGLLFLNSSVRQFHWSEKFDIRLKIGQVHIIKLHNVLVLVYSDNIDLSHRHYDVVDVLFTISLQNQNFSSFIEFSFLRHKQIKFFI